MMYYSFIVPREIFYGPGALDALATVPGKRAFIVTDQTIRNLGLVDRVEKILHVNKVKTAVFDNLEAEPEKNTVWSIVPLAQDFQPDLFIGLGGGSCMDAGKAAWALYEHPDLVPLPLLEARKELRSRTLRNKARYVAISTTSGTGSEVTPVAVISDHDTDPPSKPPLISPQLVPDVAITDPELPASMPPAVTANTGFDALAHATECYVFTSRPRDDLIGSLALGAAKTIWEWLPKAVVDGKDMVARDKMHLASLQAGMAFGNGGLGFIHALSHPLGAIFRIPHGRTLAFLLCASFAHAYSTHKARLSSLATALGIGGKDDQAKVANFLTSLEQLKQEVGIPPAIKESGLEEERFQARLAPLVNSYIDYSSNVLGRPTPTAAETKEILMHAWNGTRAELS